jgi:hypothetical protein
MECGFNLRKQWMARQKSYCVYDAVNCVLQNWICYNDYRMGKNSDKIIVSWTRVLTAHLHTSKHADIHHRCTRPTDVSYANTYCPYSLLNWYTAHTIPNSHHYVLKSFCSGSTEVSVWRRDPGWLVPDVSSQCSGLQASGSSFLAPLNKYSIAHKAFDTMF